jgi:galactitol-specific phosphotransferase system IIB component
MDKLIKILCVCNKGECRSVGARMCLNERGYTNVIAIGVTNTSMKTLAMLWNWADLILLAKPTHNVFFPISDKVYTKFTIGEDRWQDPYNKELHKIINKKLDLVGLK